jgi:hypothetical protein
VKREILCPACGRACCRMLRLDPAAGGQTEGGGEAARVVVGKVKPRLGAARLRFVCDGCAALIMGGETAYAVSFWLPGRGAYVPWEGEYFSGSHG